ncbi:acylphosphatase [Bacteroidota bacterium]
MKKSVSISVEGLVQGVGFRPFIYRLANKYNLNGNVANRTDGVIVNVKGEELDINCFMDDIIKLAPPAASIKNISSIIIDEINSIDFTILPSESLDNLITEISPDIAVCEDCLNDFKNQKHRFN